MFRKISYLVLYHLGNFGDLIQSSFRVITKIIFTNLCKPIRNIIGISVSPDPLNLETMERNEEKYKQSNISRIKRVF